MSMKMMTMQTLKKENELHYNAEDYETFACDRKKHNITPVQHYIFSLPLSLSPLFLQSELKSYGGVRLDEKLGEE